MNNKFLSCTVAVGVLLFAIVLVIQPTEAMTNALVSASPTATISPKPSVTSSPAVNRDDIKDEIKGLKNTVQGNIQDLKSQMRLSIQQKMDELKQLKAEFEAKIKAQKETLKTQIEAKKTELQSKLSKIKDEKKKDTVEKINDQLTKLNENMTSKFSRSVEQLEDVLKRIGERAKKDSDKGLDTTTVNTAIADAAAAIKASRDAIQVQAAKVYTVKITTEANLKTDVGSVRKSMYDDLDKVRTSIKSARDLVHKAAVTLGQLHGIKVSPSPSPVVSVSPTASPTATATPTPTATPTATATNSATPTP